MKRSFVFVCLSIFVSAASAGWARVPGTMYTLDQSRTQYMSNGAIKVWVKYQLPKSVLNQMIANLKKAKVAVDYSQYGYSIVQFTVLCSSFQFKTEQGHNYNKDGTVIDSYQLEPGSRPFETAVPESEGELLVKYVCSQ